MKGMEKVLTVVVPAYNMERYLGYCLGAVRQPDAAK